MGLPLLPCAGAIHQPLHQRRGATHATAPACTGAPARCRETPAHVAHVSSVASGASAVLSSQGRVRQPASNVVGPHKAREDQGVERHSGSEMKARGRQCCGRNHSLLPPLSTFPHKEERSPVPHQRGSSTHKKTPTEYGRGQPILAAAPFPRKDVSALCRAGLLARGICLLSAPSQGLTPQWSWQISIRIQLRGSDGFAPSSLITVSSCNQPYSRHIPLWALAYCSPLRFVKDIQVESQGHALLMSRTRLSWEELRSLLHAVRNCRYSSVARF
jgi:hypothetical protein